MGVCGRVRLSDDYSEIKIAFRIPPEYPTPNTYAPSWNVAPTDSLPIVRYNGKTGSRTLDMMRWGLVLYWAKDIKIGFSTINARAEEVDTKPAFRDAFKRRRCIVPVDNFYEWKKLDAKTKQPYAIGREGGGLMGLAGLWENWKSPTDEWIRSFTIVTTTPNELCGEVHNRMPVILPPETWSTWIGEEPAEPDQLKSLSVPYTGSMVAWPVSARVGNVKNNDPSLIEPVEAA
jgi:putative SOS response-associated peptidase YedK